MSMAFFVIIWPFSLRVRCAIVNPALEAHDERTGARVRRAL